MTLSHPHLLACALVLTALGCGNSSPSPDDAAASPDAVASPAFCGTSGFVDQRGTGEVTIGFGGELGSAPFGYTPACVTVNVGQTIRFVGGFNTHPLSPGTSPTDTTGSAGSPIVRTTSGTELRVTATNAGEFPYYCELHFAGNMRGIVRVVAP